MKTMLQTEEAKANFYFIIILVINLFIIAIIGAGIAIGIYDYISDVQITYSSITCCGSVCLKCFFTIHTIYTVFPWISILIFFMGIYKLIYKIFHILLFHKTNPARPEFQSAVNHHVLRRIVDSINYSEDILIFKSPLRCAFTSGLWYPKLYLTSGICTYLTSNELFAVILHELKHKKSKDPLKLFIIQLLRTLVFFIPVNQYLMERFSLASEKAADDNAVRFLGESLSLVSALVKISRSHSVECQYYPVFSFKGFHSAEARINRLLEIENISPSSTVLFKFFPCFLSFFIVAIVCVPLFFRQFEFKWTAGCNTKMCHAAHCG